MMIRCTASALVIRSLPRVSAGTDTGRRMIRGQVADLHGRSVDGKWVYVDAPAGRGWVYLQYTEEVIGGEPFPGWPKVPSGLDGIMRTFGDPSAALTRAGRVVLPEPVKLGWKNEQVSGVACHKLMEDVFTSVFRAIYDRGLWHLIETFDGIENDRTITNSQKISTHAWGISVDLNAATNKRGTRGNMDPRIVAIFKDHGFVWGGDWSEPDPMHFQYARNY